MISANHKKIALKIALSIALIVAAAAILDYPWISANLKFLLSQKLNPAPTAQKNSAALKGQPNQLQIPSLKITAPVVYVDQANETAFQAGLKNGVVHYPGTALPGQIGNVYIFGHSSDYIWSNGHYKTVFAVLPRIKIGAEIDLSDSSGHIYSYVTTGSAIASPTELKYLSQDTAGKKELTLQTSYPVGTALKRFLVFAEMK